ncbi:MAG: NVEALA domain-containing protein [Bacteroidaceae bacterium]|nr:NVEALA domain-containing protein [Bacteroidaceae bacterium]
MKKKNLSAAVVVAALFTGYGAYDAQRSLGMDDTLLANVEALANNTGESVETEICYVQQSGSPQMSSKKFCDSKTDDTHIYSCPTSESFGGYSELQKDRCIK